MGAPDRRAAGAAVDLLVPAYRTRARHTVPIGDVVTTEVPGLAEALRRPGVHVDALLHLTTGSDLPVRVVIPDAIGSIAMKVFVRSARREARDIDDLWRCLEVAAACGVVPSDFDTAVLKRVRAQLWRQLGPEGVDLSVLTADLQADAAARRRTRVRALLSEVVGVDTTR